MPVPAMLGWITHMSSFDLMNWEQRDPSGATVRGIGEQELDPLGADAGTFATSVPPPKGPSSPTAPLTTRRIRTFLIRSTVFVCRWKTLSRLQG